MGNAKQAAAFYTGRFGFEYYAYKGLETGSREVATHVVINGKAIIALSSPYSEGQKDMNGHIAKHGDGVKDVAFTVDDATKVFEVSRFPTPFKTCHSTVLSAVPSQSKHQQS